MRCKVCESKMRQWDETADREAQLCGECKPRPKRRRKAAEVDEALDE